MEPCIFSELLDIDTKFAFNIMQYAFIPDIIESFENKFISSCLCPYYVSYKNS